MKERHRNLLKSLFTAVLALLILTVIVLYFIFRPKAPVVVATPVSLLHFEFSINPKIILSLTIGVDAFIKNPNLTPFEYDMTTVRVYYRGTLVGEALVPPGTIEKRGVKDIGAPVELFVSRVISNPKFSSDATHGVLNMIAISRTEGHANILGFVKVHATIFVECYVSVFLLTATAGSNCVSKIKI